MVALLGVVDFLWGPRRLGSSKEKLSYKYLSFRRVHPQSPLVHHRIKAVTPFPFKQSVLASANRGFRLLLSADIPVPFTAANDHERAAVLCLSINT